ncbi:DUF6461 domain-containing protein [Blastococcus sp. TF02A_35]|uniref:DUF6461 domain-containing protein n=1 Tax=Blastococcus sp. TF02A-35 TaxID=2559612 RepID=UPI0010738E54|nr:DUF6461 domain-containing protein [Blastococcus sp. TF02A_35]TFV52701.1 hypothetical protein E4P43_05225 [Blastococcus sp. TF02A_35]
MSGYDWVDMEAYTITMLEGGWLEEVAHLLRLDPSTERMRTFDEADAEGGPDHFPVQVEELEGWLVVVEPNGFQLADRDLLARLSRGGTAVSSFRNVNAHAEFLVARRGEVVRAFDPVVPGDEEGDPLPEEEGLDFADEDADPDALAFTLMERLTGVRIEESWLLERPRRTWLAPHPPVGAPEADGGRYSAPDARRTRWMRQIS